MKREDLKQIGEVVDNAVEKHLVSVHEEISDLRSDVATKDELAKLASQIESLDAKIDRVESKLGAFENVEVDKRKQLEVKVTRLEKRVGV